MHTPHQIGPMLQISPHETTITEGLPQTVLLHGTTPLRVSSTMVRTEGLEEDHHHTVVAVVVVIPLAGRVTASGKMASIFQVLPTHALSVSFSVPPTTLQNCRPESISRTMMTSLWKHLVMMFPSLPYNSPTHRWMTISYRTSNLRTTRHLRLCRNTPFLSSWEVEI